MGVISGVFDHTPQNTVFPYITFGEVISRDWSNAAQGGAEQLVSLQIWSREGGRKQAISIMEKVYDLLHQASLEVESQTLVLMRFVTSKITLGNDGFTYQGTMQFRALMRAE